MELETVSVQERARFLPLLAEGFPQMSLASWEAGFSRWLESEQICSERAGCVLTIDGVDQGVLLTIRSPRQWGAEPKTLVSLSSWYVREAARLHAVSMLRTILREKDCVFLDTSPTEQVAKISKLLKLKEISRGLIRINIATTALKRDKATILDTEATISRVDDQALARSLRDHVRWGFVVKGVDIDGQVTPLLMQRRKIRNRIPGLFLAYAPDLSVIDRAAGSLCRQLLRDGHFILDLDNCGALNTGFGRDLKNYGVRIASAEYPENTVDFLNSELSLFAFK